MTSNTPRFVPVGYMPIRDAVMHWADLLGMPVPPQRPEAIIYLPADSRSELRQRWRAVSRTLQQELYDGHLRAFQLTETGHLSPLRPDWWGSTKADLVLNGRTEADGYVVSNYDAGLLNALLLEADLERRATMVTGRTFAWNADLGVTFERAVRMLVHELEARDLPAIYKEETGETLAPNPSGSRDPERLAVFLTAAVRRGGLAALVEVKPGKWRYVPEEVWKRQELADPLTGVVRAFTPNEGADPLGTDRSDGSSALVLAQRRELRALLPHKDVVDWMYRVVIGCADQRPRKDESQLPLPPARADARPRTGDNVPSVWAEATGRVAGWLAAYGKKSTRQIELERKLQEQVEDLDSTMSEPTARRLASAMLKGFKEETD
jgi:hypothetical protein